MRFHSQKAKKVKKSLSCIHMMVALCWGQEGVCWAAIHPGMRRDLSAQRSPITLPVCLALCLFLWQTSEEVYNDSRDSTNKCSDKFLWMHCTWPSGNKGRMQKMSLKTNTYVHSCPNQKKEKSHRYGRTPGLMQHTSWVWLMSNASLKRPRGK